MVKKPVPFPPVKKCPRCRGRLVLHYVSSVDQWQYSHIYSLADIFGKKKICGYVEVAG